MKLKNKKTGEIGFVYTGINGEVKVCSLHSDIHECLGEYKCLAELNEEWEDYEEPKGIQCIYYVNHFDAARIDGVIVGFGTREEAEKAVEKLKAWKRLKDKGFRFDPVGRYEALCGNGFNIPITATMPPEAYTDAEVSKDLDIFFRR